MNKFKKVLLTKDEKRVIKKVTKVQMQSLMDILNRNCEEDITLWAIMEDLTEEEIFIQAQKALKKFERISKQPSKVFTLDQDNLRMFKHVMVNYTNHSRYEDGRRGIWRKLIIIEKSPINLN